MIVIYEDDLIVVVDKPGGVVTNDAQSTVGTETVQSWFAKKMGWSSPNSSADSENEFLQKQGVVHRLDKDTSGVMVLAKTEAAYENLKLQFLERGTKKTYIALVHGLLKEKEGVIAKPIERHSKNKHKFAIGSDPSRTAITEWKVINEYRSEGNEYSLVELSPRTGRTHQLRVHLQSMQHPIVSDPIYGFGKRLKEDQAICPRLFLHAKLLEINHPGTGEKMRFEAEIPSDLNKVLTELVH